MLNAVPDQPDPPSPRRTSGAFTGSGIERTFDIVRALQDLQEANNGREVSLREIAAAAKVPLGSTRRYLEKMADPKVDVVRQPKYGTYMLTWRAPIARAQARPPKRLAVLLTQLQGQTGQIAMLFTPYLLNHERLCTEASWGTHKPMVNQDLDIAPLDADAPGLVMQAAMHDWSRTRDESASHLRVIRETGYAISQAPVDTHVFIAAPVFEKAAVAAAVAIMPMRHLMESTRRRGDYIHAVLDTAGAMSSYLSGPTPSRSRSARLLPPHRTQTCTPFTAQGTGLSHVQHVRHRRTA